MLTVFVSIPLLLLPVVSVPAPSRCGVQPVAATAIEQPVLDLFTQRLDAYMRVHNEVERALPSAWSFADAEDMFEAVEAMQAGIRAARPDARRGAIFSADVGALIRRRLHARLAACQQSVEQLLAFINEERQPGASAPAINEPFPWELGSAMLPTLLAALPVLPDELQYRFADRDLVLIDIPADLVVAILVNALPAPGDRTHGTHHR